MMVKQNNTLVNGQRLVADFQAAYIEIVMSNTARQEAESSENELLGHLASWSKNGYLDPGTIQPEGQDTVSRASLDAHIKKIQARQVDAMKTAHLSSLNEQAQAAYIGRKITIIVKDSAHAPLEIVWFSQQTGYRSNVMKKKRITGVVESLDLDRNVLVIRPSRILRLINSDLVAYVVYVINPENAEPMVEATFT